MYVRDSEVIVLRPGLRGTDHASERLTVTGRGETDILPQDDEIDLHRIVLPHHLPETILTALPGRRVRDVVEVPDELRGACPRRGCDHAGDTLFTIADRRILSVRRIERGVLLVIETLTTDETGMYR